MLIRKLYNNGKIIIPKKVTHGLGMKDGSLLYIYKLKETIVIESEHEDKYLNQATLYNGNLTIPRELRKLLDLEDGSLLEMEVCSNSKKIYLKKTS